MLGARERTMKKTNVHPSRCSESNEGVTNEDVRPCEQEIEKQFEVCLKEECDWVVLN